MFIANDCGTGKTITYAGMVDFYVRKLSAVTETPTYRPVLLLTLSTLTPITFERISDFFQGTLTIYCLYGNPKEEKDMTKRAFILDEKSFVKKLESLDPTNPQVSSDITSNIV